MRELKHVISLGQFWFPKENPRDLKPISTELKELIKQMLIVNSEKRVSIPKILAHPWLNQNQTTDTTQQGLNCEQLLQA